MTFSMTVLTKKFSKDSDINSRASNFKHFHDKMAYLFFLQNEALRSESVQVSLYLFNFTIPSQQHSYFALDIVFFLVSLQWGKSTRQCLIVSVWFLHAAFGQWYFKLFYCIKFIIIGLQFIIINTFLASSGHVERQTLPLKHFKSTLIYLLLITNKSI